MALTLFFAQANSSLAALVIGGQQLLPGNPVQDLVLLPGTPFNPGTTEVVLPDVAVFGTSVFDRLDQVGTTIEMINGSFTGSGFYPGLGNFVLNTGAPFGFTPMTATLENVLQDANHPGFATGDPASIISADITFVVPNWGVRLLDSNVDLEVRDSFEFVGTLDGLPPTDGTVIADPFLGNNDRLEVFMVGGTVPIGFSQNRRFVFNSVPEPSSVSILLLGIACGLCRRGRR